MKIGSYTDDENKATIVGEKLISKKIGNSDWKVVLSGENVYETGWYFVKKGTELPGFGKLEKNWLINYNFRGRKLFNNFSRRFISSKRSYNF